jgi:hypothetical protein
MRSKKIVSSFLSLVFLLVLAGAAAALEPYPVTGSGGEKKAIKKITVKGKVDYQKGLGGFLINGEAPSGKFIIVNPNPGLLEELKKKGKTVLIEGYLTVGVDHLFIEKIDGKPYPVGKGGPYPVEKETPYPVGK